MKRIICFQAIALVLCLFAASRLFSQAPEGIIYQAEARDDKGVLIRNIDLIVKISILEGTIDGTIVWEGMHETSTSNFGIFTIVIGEGEGGSYDFSQIEWANYPHFLNVKVTDRLDNLVDMGTTQLLSVPYALHAKTAGNVFSGSYNDLVDVPTGGSGSLIPIYTAQEIELLEPEPGLAVFNHTENLYQIYLGESWASFSASCWPQPTIADASEDQYLTDNTLSVTLNANTPELNHGTGSWSVISGEGGTFDDANNPSATFTGTGCAEYNLRWSIVTACGTSEDEVMIGLNHTPTVAAAGADQIFTDGTTNTVLAANAPEPDHGTGTWSVVVGDGGTFTDVHDPVTSFTGDLRKTYRLKWTIATECGVSNDEMYITFGQDEPGEAVSDADGNSYNTVWIGTQLWMAENLKTTSDKTGNPLTYGTDYSWYDDDEAAYKDSYGALYSSLTFENGNLCPDGWRVPTATDWTALRSYIGNDANKLKETGTLFWDGTNENANNETGFSARGGGYWYNGTYNGILQQGYWWGYEPDISPVPYIYRMRYYTDQVEYVYPTGYQYYRNSVRCIKE